MMRMRFLYLIPLFACCSLGFTPQHHQPQHRRYSSSSSLLQRRQQQHQSLRIVVRAKQQLGDEDLPIANTNSNKALQEELSGRADKLQVEKARESLEQQNTQSFLKRRPVKLPYEIARKWVQYNLGVDTQAEFEDLVANGNVRTPYIPQRPEEYYTHTREWISWEHFLTGYHNNQHPSAIRPSDGIFD